MSKAETGFSFPRPRRELIAPVIALVLAGCGAKNEASTEPVRPGNEAALSDASKEVKPVSAESTPTPDAAEQDSGSDTSTTIEAMISSGYTGGNAVAIKDQTAGEAIIWNVNTIKDQLASQGVTMDMVEEVINNASEEELDIILKDFNLPEEEWPHIRASDDVKAGTALIYTFLPADSETQ